MEMEDYMKKIEMLLNEMRLEAINKDDVGNFKVTMEDLKVIFDNKFNQSKRLKG